MVFNNITAESNLKRMNKENRTEEITKLIIELASGNFGYRLEISDTDDEMDAIIAGINMLGEELQASTVSRDYLTSIFEGVADILVVLHPDGSIQNINTTAEKLLAYHKRDLLGKPFSLLFADATSQAVQELIGQIHREGHCYNIEASFLSLHKRIIPVSCSFSLLYNQQKNISGILCIAKDITDQKAAAEELKRSKELFELALQASNDGIWDWDLTTNHIYFSPRWKHMLGYADHELSNSLASWVRVIFREDYKLALSLIEAYNKGLIPEFRVIQRYHHKNGSVVYLLSRAIHHKNEKGEVVRMIWAHTDITAQKLSEIELQNAKEQAETANRSKSRFLSSMSHEIRTPLNGILGFTEFLLQTPLNAEQTEYLQLVQTSGQNLSKLLSDILDLNKIEEGKLSLENIDFNFRDFISTNIKPYRYMAEEKKLGFSLTFDPLLPYYAVKGDPTRINQILVNLLGNALKFTQEGGIAIHFELVPQSGQPGEIYIKGSVTDTGPGIPDEKQKAIFESFTQADNSITRKFGGSGLGLTIVKQLTTLMGGQAGVISPVIAKPFHSTYPGSAFWFTCKLSVSTAHAIPARFTTENKKLYFEEPYEVLIVEDNQVNQLIAAKVLKDLGAQVSIVENGQEAVEKVSQENFDIIFMDIQMPVMDGYTASRRLRAKGYKKPIIGLSANVYKEDIDKCLEAGMNAHIAKPFTKQEIYTVVTTFVPNK